MQQVRFRKLYTNLHDREKTPGNLHDGALATDLDASEHHEDENGAQRPAGSVLDLDPAPA